MSRETHDTTAPRPRWMLPALLFVSAAVHAGMVANTAVTARDSVGFARYALNLESPNAGREGTGRTVADVVREEKHPPGYPTLVLAASRVVRPLYAAPLPEQMLRATQVASAAAAVLLVLPTFWLARHLFDRWVGFWAALLFQLLPVVARDTSDGLSDGPFLLFALSAVAVGVWSMRPAAAGWGHVGCGALAGLAYLVRPEGILIAVAAAAVGLLVWLAGRSRLRVAGRQAVGVAVGFLAVGGPYMLFIGDVTNKPAMQSRPDEPDSTAGVRGVQLGGARAVFAEVLTTEARGAARVASVAGVIGKEWMKVAHYGVGILAVTGLLVLHRRVWADPRFWLPLGYAAGHLSTLVLLGYKQGYVSERHLLPVTFVGVLFAVGGLPAWFALWSRAPLIGPLFRWRHWPAFTLVGLAVSCLPPLFKPLHDNRVGHKYAGDRLAAELEKLTAADPAAADEVVVIDHYEWAQFFSGRALYRIPPDPPAERQRVVYGVLELKDGRPETAAFQSDRHRTAVALYTDPANPPEWVYRWPTDGPPEAARVVLFKQVRK